MLILLVSEYNKVNGTEDFISRSQLAAFPSFKATTLNQAIVFNAPRLIDNMISLLG